MRTVRRFTQLDVFTAEPLKATPLAVVHDAQWALDDAQMAPSRWTNLSRKPPSCCRPRSRRRLPRAHLHAGRELPFRLPPDARQLLAGLATGGPAARRR